MADRDPVPSVSTVPPVAAAGRGDERWRAMLREERIRLRLTQGQVAAAADLSEETIRKYEAGVRSPSRAALFRILEALKVPQLRAREILADAGYAPKERLFPLSTHPGYFFSVAEAAAYVETVPWPRFVVNNVMEIVLANRAAQLLWEIDLEAEHATRTRPELHFLALLVEPRFAAHIVNFEECLLAAVSIFKAVQQGGAALEPPGPWVESIFERFAANAEVVANDRDAHAGLAKALETVPPAEAKVHFGYRVVWRDPIGGEIRFRGVVSNCSEPDGLSFNDWIPLDAASYANLECVIAGRIDAGAHVRPVARGRLATRTATLPAEPRDAPTTE